MKKITVLLVFLATGLQLMAQVDPVVAKVSYTKTDIITQRDFKAKQSILEKLTGKALAPADKKELLNSMVKEVVVLQAAERQGMRISEAEVVENTKATLKFAGSDEELKKAVKTQVGMDWNQFLEAQKKTLIVQKYVQSNPKLNDLRKLTIADKDVQEFYNKNKSQFMNPDMIRISHIFFDTKKSPKGTLAEIQKRADETRAKLASGQTFESLVRQFSEDEGSKNSNGDIGFLPRSATTPQGQQILSVFGDEFINGAFSVKVGDVSKVLKSNMGFHIVKVTDKLDQRFLGLDDPIAPLQKMTVKEYIRAALLQQAQQGGMAKLIEEMVSDLMKTAKVEIFEKNL